ncbi:MAG: ATP-dependent DNA helicase Rep [Candidatus Dactylopiibacterium carminicum]|uniref:ATP-dependent DNA helicase Rep n=1 Tax=Candidatus Dactylopiibacterium carminicum TaxID=857335 RepID=A0A272EYC4_9RHOO|nr:UvrD-helicase domain-containing protein [Candidatus Dactylopiibacterium carminicum]KAF7600644.1 ATP-dependent DNA helicase Rep [Candidatus Dactylopiibacterium carminicum]PAS95122.1 MAG: ATP-dependent DNA helicase Rep [Candidatus Dactylopiibacterium carminicum]PAS97926.1 MAG: ATP-dependent DNA helicase Rep [Candidatus Dactylopiibacterium carminicum]PAT00641.1 MAG: ATP-dependent DNA helicase Rep [Candidatus Dactylopiibacterium carminicum]
MLDQLNAPQRDAVKYLDGPCLVLAGAGSGKTRVITQKIAYMVQQCGLEARNIAAITFTNKAAREMHERVAKLLDKRSARQLTVCTFHALGVRIVRQEAQHVGLKPQFSILDTSDLQQILAELSGNADKATIKGIQWTISGWKNALIPPEEAVKLVTDETSHAAAKLYPAYEKTLRAYQGVDFDDLIALPVRLFDSHEDALERWRGKLRYLLVDEYQDTNRAQYKLLRQLAGDRGAFTAVGDDDQAIYAWRGADVENLHLLQRDYPKLRVIKLEQNYRSSNRILNAANTLIANNEKLFEKKLWSDHGLGEPIQVTLARDPEHEAELVAMKLTAHKFEFKTHFRDYAILYRGNHQARIIEQQLRNHHIPYVMSGGQSFFDRAEIRDLLSYLRLMANPDDDLAFIRAITTPRRGVGAATLEALGNYAGRRHGSLFNATFEEGAAEHVPARQLEVVRKFGSFIKQLDHRAYKEPAGALLEELLRAIGYQAWLMESCEVKEAETKWRNVRDFVEWLARRGEEDQKTLHELVQTVALINMLDKGDDGEVDAVQLATLHASKGLEWPHVFLIGVEEGMLPHQSSIDEDKIEEERRLMYVGVTRAQRSLTITACERRRFGGEIRMIEASRFIDEMGDGLRRASKDDVPVSQDEGRARLANLRAMLAGKPQA